MGAIILVSAWLACACHGRRVALHDRKTQGISEFALEGKPHGEAHSSAASTFRELSRLLLAQSNQSPAASPGARTDAGQAGSSQNVVATAGTEAGPLTQTEDQKKRTRSWPWQQKDAALQAKDYSDNVQNRMMLKLLRQELLRERHEIEEHFEGLLEKKDEELQILQEQLQEERNRTKAAVEEGAENLERATRHWESKQLKWFLDREKLEEGQLSFDRAVKTVESLKAEKAQLELDLSTSIDKGLENSNLVDSLLAENSKLESDLKRATYQVLKDSSLVSSYKSEKEQLTKDLASAVEQHETLRAEKARLEYDVQKGLEFSTMVTALKSEKEQLQKDLNRVIFAHLERMLKADIPRILYEEPDFSICADDLKVISQAGAKVEGVPPVKSLLELMRRIPKAFVVEDEIKVEAVDAGDGNVTYVGKWRIQLGHARMSPARFWHRGAPLDIAVETLFLPNSGGQVERVRFGPWRVNGQDSELPQVDFSDKPSKSLKKINDWAQELRGVSTSSRDAHLLASRICQQLLNATRCVPFRAKLKGFRPKFDAFCSKLGTLREKYWAPLQVGRIPKRCNCLISAVGRIPKRCIRLISDVKGSISAIKESADTNVSRQVAAKTRLVSLLFSLVMSFRFVLRHLPSSGVEDVSAAMPPERGPPKLKSIREGLGLKFAEMFAN